MGCLPVGAAGLPDARTRLTATASPTASDLPGGNPAGPRINVGCDIAEVGLGGTARFAPALLSAVLCAEWLGISPRVSLRLVRIQSPNTVWGLVERACPRFDAGRVDAGRALDSPLDPHGHYLRCDGAFIPGATGAPRAGGIPSAEHERVRAVIVQASSVPGASLRDRPARGAIAEQVLPVVAVAKQGVEDAMRSLVVTDPVQSG